MDEPSRVGAAGHAHGADGDPAVEALRRSEARYIALVEASGQVVWSWTAEEANGDFAQTQVWWEELTGQTVEQQRGSHTAWLDVVHPDDRAAAAAAWGTALATGVKYDMEYRVAARAGGWRHVRANGVPIRNPDGSVREWVGTLADITDRRRAEADLRQSDARFRRLATAGIIGVIRWDLDRSLILDANDEFLRMTGYDRADLAAGRLDFRAMTPPEWSGRNEVGIRELRETGVGGAYEKEYFRKDGSRVPVIIVGVRFEDAPAEGMSFVMDITERKKAEAEASRLAERLRLALDAGGTGVWEWDIVTGRITWSDQVHAFYGMVPGEFDGTLETFARHLHPGDADRARRAIRASVEDDAPYRIEYRIVPKGGGVRWIFTAGRVVRGPAGEPLRMVGATVDVTERRRAEDALRESDARSRFLLDLEAATRPLTDPAAIMAAASRVLGEYLGASRVAYFEIDGPEYVVERDYADGVVSLAGRYPVASFGGWLVGEFMAGRTVVESDATAVPSRAADERAAFAALGVRGHVDVPLVKAGAFVAGMTVHCEGPREWTPGEVALIEQTAERTWAAVERGRAERALRASEGRFRALFEAMDEGYCVVAPVLDGAGRAVDYRYVLANPALEHLTGLRGVVGKTAREVMPGHESHWIEAYATVAATGEPMRRTDHVADLGRWYDVSAFPVGGGLVGVLFDDVTDRVRAEESLRDADRKKDDFIALLAHELRNPLAPIRSGLQVLRLADDRPSRDRAREMMDRQLSHMVRLVDDLLDVSRINRGKMELRRGRVALADAVASAVEAARPGIDAGGHELAVSLPAAPVHLDADLTRLAQVFGNLLTNSAKYTPPGGRIWLAAERRGGQVEVSVRDTGIGIPPGALHDIFDMFSQVDRGAERGTGGLGIGLALVKGLVEMHGGSVAAASEGEGKGSTFTVMLPVAPERPEAHAEPRGQGHAGGLRILVVDDNRDGAASLAMLLELLGNEVRTAHDGLEAVATAGEFRPEVILMDVGMPRLNGLDATRRIREQPWGEGMTIIALTGWGQENDRERSREAGCDGHLVKPVALPDLEKMLVEGRR